MHEWGKKATKPGKVKQNMGIGGALRKIFVKELDPAAAELYAAAVVAARQPAFYAHHGVPDTLDGRFDLLLLHVALIMLRLNHEDLKQNLFDFMFADMDRSLREMGVGDMSIGKKIKPMLEGFYGRGTTYKAALAESGNAALEAALARNLYGGAANGPEHAPAMARYVRDCVASLAQQSDADLAAGKVSFPSLA